MKIGNWAILKLHKRCSILSSTEVLQKLTQQYNGLFQIFQKIGRLTYKLDIPRDSKVYFVFSVAQLKLVTLLANDFFHYPYAYIPLTIFVKDDINATKSVELNRPFNKCTVKKNKNGAVGYLICWTKYGPESNK